MRLASVVHTFLPAILGLGFAIPSVRADIILEQYEFQNLVGTEKTLKPSFVTAGLTGVAVAEGSGLTPNAGANSLNTAGWNNSNATAFYSLGFSISPGQQVTVDQLILTTKSSGTGPGSLNVEVSADGGALQSVATITQSGTNYNDEILALKPVTATTSLTFYFVTANQTSTNGGTIGSTGTFRIGDYNPTGAPAPTPFTINGTITPRGTAVPEPSAIVLTLIGLGSLGLVVRTRQRHV